MKRPNLYTKNLFLIDNNMEMMLLYSHITKAVHGAFDKGVRTGTTSETLKNLFFNLHSTEFFFLKTTTMRGKNPGVYWNFCATQMPVRESRSTSHHSTTTPPRSSIAPLCHICISIQVNYLTMNQMRLPYLYNSGQQRFLSHTKGQPYHSTWNTFCCSPPRSCGECCHINTCPLK